MAKVQTAVLHIDTLLLEHYNLEGQIYKETCVSREEARLLLAREGYKFTGTKFDRCQKVYMRAVAEKDEAHEWS